MRRWFCCRRSLVCVVDNLLHRLRLPHRRICDRHEAAIWASVGALHDLDDVADEFGVDL